MTIKKNLATAKDLIKTISEAAKKRTHALEQTVNKKVITDSEAYNLCKAECENSKQTWAEYDYMQLQVDEKTEEVERLKALLDATITAKDETIAEQKAFIENQAFFIGQQSVVIEDQTFVMLSPWP